MRLRKKKWSNDVFEIYQNYWYDVQKAPKGNWKKILNTNVIRLEIGSGKGDYWHQLSKLYPNEGIIALEKDYTASSIALKKLEDNPETNKRFLFGNANELSDIFSPKEVDIIHLNFSDPWPKKKHTKRRLTYDTKLNEYKNILNDNGLLIMKTDNVGLFNYSVVNITNNGFKLIELDVDFRSQPQEDPFTEYERKFHEMGQPIYRGVWQKI